ncbi:MAG: M48 family metalloprotease [Alphaproteobacteria bacterium]|nr:M48 family metalloprotease [Alphaproteobacteria bacterium]
MAGLVLFAVAPEAARAQGTSFSVIRDAETETVLRTYASPLFRTAGLESNLVRIILVNAQGINAFVTPGNQMFIHTGLILQTQGVMELAGVLAHETGHIAGGHLARLPEEMRRAMITSIAAAIVGAAAGAAAGRGDVGMAAAVGGAGMAQRSLFAFTRSQEQAADQAAMRYMERLGWSARGLETLLGRMIEQDLLIAGRRDPYMLTHPLTRERLDFVRNHIARSRHADAPPPPGFEASFEMMRAKLRAFIEAPQRTLATYREDNRSDPARYARAIALFRSGRWQDSVAILDAMIAERPGSPWLHELKGQVLFESGRARDSLPPHREAVRLAPREPLIRLAHGRALMESNDPALLRQAIGEFEAALRAERDSAFTWRQLGIAYGRAGNMGMSALALAEEALLLGKPGEARMLATRAAAQLPAGPRRLRAQDLAAAAAEERRLQRNR